jgi:hypothetical protein
MGYWDNFPNDMHKQDRCVSIQVAIVHTFGSWKVGQREWTRRSWVNLRPDLGSCNG